MSVVVIQHGLTQQSQCQEDFSSSLSDSRCYKVLQHQEALNDNLQCAAVVAANKRPVPVRASARSRRKGCTRCFNCSGVARNRHISSCSSREDEEFREWWPAGLQSPTIYYHLRRRQLAHTLQQQQTVRSLSGVWRDPREATPAGAAPSALRGKRGLQQLQLALPAARTNVSQSDVTVRFLGFRNVPLKPPPQDEPGSPRATHEPPPPALDPAKPHTQRPSPFLTGTSCSVTPASCIATPSPQQSHIMHSTRSMQAVRSSPAAAGLPLPVPAPARASSLGSRSASVCLRPPPGHAVLKAPADSAQRFAERKTASAPCSAACTLANTPVDDPLGFGATPGGPCIGRGAGGECLKRTRSGFALVRAHYATSAASSAPRSGHFIAAAATSLDMTLIEQSAACKAPNTQQPRPGTARRVVPRPSPAVAPPLSQLGPDATAASFVPNAQHAQHASQPCPLHHTLTSAGLDTHAMSLCYRPDFDFQAEAAVQQQYSAMQLDLSSGPSSQPSPCLSPSCHKNIPLFSFRHPSGRSTSAAVCSASSRSSPVISVISTPSLLPPDSSAISPGKFEACSGNVVYGGRCATRSLHLSGYRPPAHLEGLSPFLTPVGASSSAAVPAPAPGTASQEASCSPFCRAQAPRPGRGHPPGSSWGYYRRQFEIKSEQAFTCLEVVDLAPAPSGQAPAGAGGSAVWDGLMWPLRSLAAGISRKMSPGRPGV